MRARLGGGSDTLVLSAGFEDIESARQKYDDHPHPQVIEVMKEKGVDISGQHITQLTEDLLKQAMVVIVLVKEEELPDYTEPYKSKIRFFPVDDPAKGSNVTVPQLDMARLRLARDSIEYMVAGIRTRTH